MAAHPSFASAEAVDGGLVRLQLERILASKAFSNADRLKRFLEFIVSETLEGRGDQLKEYRGCSTATNSGSTPTSARYACAVTDNYVVAVRLFGAGLLPRASIESRSAWVEKGRYSAKGRIFEISTS